jgi:hypothetical protein
MAMNDALDERTALGRWPGGRHYPRLHFDAVGGMTAFGKWLLRLLLPPPLPSSKKLPNVELRTNALLRDRTQRREIDGIWLAPIG